MKRQQGFGPIEGQGLSDQDLVAFVEGSAAKEGSESAEASHVAQVTVSGHFPAAGVHQAVGICGDAGSVPRGVPGSYEFLSRCWSRTIFDATFGSFVQLDAGSLAQRPS